MTSNCFKTLSMCLILFIFCSLSLFLPASATESQTEFSGYVVKLAENPVSLLSDEIDPLFSLGFAKVDDEETAKALVDFGIGESYEPDYIVHMYDESNQPIDEFYNVQYAPSQIGADKVWKLGFYGEGVKVCIIDSGCSPHIELDEKISSRYYYFKNNSDVTDEHGHGTHVAGIIAASLNGVGVVGIAPKCTLGIIKAFTKDEAYSTTSSVIGACIRYAVDKMSADVINMSLGANGTNLVLNSAVSYALDKGVVLCAAVGNDGTTTSDITYPAANNGVIGVGAVTNGGGHASYSRVNSSVYVSAGGSSIYSCINASPTSYSYKTGTSMATPVVSGAIALLLSASPNLSPTQINELIANTSTDLGESGYDTTYGYGLLNIYAIVKSRIPSGVFTSPITEFTVNSVTKQYLSVYNNTASDITTVNAVYNRGRLTDFSSAVYSPQETVKYSFSVTDEFTERRLIFLQNLLSLVPLRKACNY